MKEHQSIGICQICSERKGSVLQGRHCVSDVETSGSCDPLKSWRKCVLLAHTRWRNSVLHRWLMYKAEKAQGGRFVGPLSMKCESRGDAVLAKAASSSSALFKKAAHLLRRLKGAQCGNRLFLPMIHVKESFCSKSSAHFLLYLFEKSNSQL